MDRLKIYIQTHKDVEFSKDIWNNEFNISSYNYSDEYESNTDKYSIYNVNEYHEGITIDKYHRFFCEYCVMYYVWKNHIYSEYITFSHYRRFITYDEASIIFKHPDRYIFYYLMYYSNNAPNSSTQQPYNYSNDICMLIEENFYIAHLLMNLRMPHWLLKDTLEYIQNIKEKYIDTYKVDIRRYYNSNYKWIFPNRSIFSSSWNNFDRLMRFIDDYYNYIFNQHGISFDTLKEWYIDHIISYYQNTLSHYPLYQDMKTYLTMFDSDKGYNTSNVWRLFAYILEIFIGYFLMGNDAIMANEKQINLLHY